jgi:PPOX class probable F420-dependent enzyme
MMPVTPEIPAQFKDLLTGRGVAILSTNGADGYPQTTALWFLFDETENRVRFSLNTSRRKTTNMRRDPRVSVFFIDLQNPYRTLELRGTVTLAPDDDYAFADQVSAHYGAGSLRENDRPGESRVVVTLQTEKVNTFGG